MVFLEYLERDGCRKRRLVRRRMLSLMLAPAHANRIFLELPRLRQEPGLIRVNCHRAENLGDSMS